MLIVALCRGCDSRAQVDQAASQMGSLIETEAKPGTMQTRSLEQPLVRRRFLLARLCAKKEGEEEGEEKKEGTSTPALRLLC